MLDMTSITALAPREPGMHYAPPPAVIAEREFPADTTCLSAIRAFIDAAVTGRADATDIVLVGSELAANSIVHASRPGDMITVAVAVDGDLVRVDVTDTGTGGDIPHVHDADDDSLSGRGMTLVDALSVRWGYYGDVPGAKTTWCEFLRPRVPQPRPAG